MLRSFLLLAAPLALGLIACGSEVAVLGDGAAGGFATSGTGTGTDTATGTSTGTSTTSTSPLCGRTHDHFAMEAKLFGGEFFGCEDTLELNMVGQIVQTVPNHFSLDTCWPAADCTPQLSYFAFDAAGLYVTLPSDAFVRVQAHAEMTSDGCAYFIGIDNVPSWDGLDNPVTKQKRLWLAAAEGPGLAPNAPLWIEPVGLGCYPGQVGCVPKEDYLMRFSSSAPGAQPVDVPMGSTVYWQLGPNVAQVRNLRSYKSGDCDEEWNWAFWLSGNPPLEE